jgi:HSP20 family molecular chaperone IbpA
MTNLTRLNQVSTWVEDLWTERLNDFTKSFRSVLPYSFSVSSDKKTAKFEMAMAGYAASDLEVTYSNEGILNIKTNKTNKESESLDYLHKGIANRFFQFAMPIFSSYIVKDAIMKDGLLTISFERLSSSEPTKVSVKSV